MGGMKLWTEWHTVCMRAQIFRKALYLGTVRQPSFQQARRRVYPSALVQNAYILKDENFQKCQEWVVKLNLWFHTEGHYDKHLWN